jgi:hypothetical protein
LPDVIDYRLGELANYTQGIVYFNRILHFNWSDPLGGDSNQLKTRELSRADGNEKKSERDLHLCAGPTYPPVVHLELVDNALSARSARFSG